MIRSGLTAAGLMVCMLVGGLVASGCGDDGVTALPDATAPDITNTFDDETVSFHGTAGPVDRMGVLSGAAGVQVCVQSHPTIDCVQTDASGLYLLTGLPADTLVTLTFRHDDLLDGATSIRTPLSGAGTMGAAGLMLTNARAEDIITLAGYSYPLTNVGILLVVLVNNFDGRVAGATATAATGDAPVYFGATGQPSLSLTSSPVGVMLMADRQPGETSFTLDTPGYRCDLGGATVALGSQPGEYRSTIFADTMTTAAFSCGDAPQAPWGEEVEEEIGEEIGEEISEAQHRG